MIINNKLTPAVLMTCFATLVIFSNNNTAQAQSCYSVTNQTLDQPANESKSGDGYYWEWIERSSSVYTDVDADYKNNYQGSQTSSDLILWTDREPSDPEVSIVVTKTRKSTSTATDNGSCGSSTRLMCLQGGVCVNQLNDIENWIGSLSNGDNALTYSRLAGDVSTDNNDFISDQNEYSKMIVQHKKESDTEYYNVDATNTGPKTTPNVNYFSDEDTGWTVDSNEKVSRNGVGLHFDVSDTFNYSGTTIVVSEFEAVVRSLNDGYDIADSIIDSIAVRSAATDVSSGAACP